MWTVEFVDEFEAEFVLFPDAVKDSILTMAILLQREGPSLGRPHADTLKGSLYANMKELRCHAHGGAWRVAFAFDPERKAILLVAGNKSGTSQRRFYKQLIATADERFGRHLDRMKG